MLVLQDTTHVYGFWFVPHFGPDGEPDADWMGCVLRQEGETWKAVYRFRYYLDDKSHNSADDKDWYSIESKSKGDVGPADLIKVMDSISIMLTPRPGDPSMVKKVIVNGTGEQAMELLAKEEWAHINVEEAPERPN